MFSLRNKSNHIPQYVGMTKKHFAKEVFNPNNLVKILTGFGNDKGTLRLHLLAKPNDANTGFLSVGLKALAWTEMFLLLLCRKKNPEIVNIMGKPFLDDAGIANITDTAKGKGANIRTFRNVLGLDKFGMVGAHKPKAKQNNQPSVQSSPHSSIPLTP